jgi:glutathionylspermidine synthase
MQRIAAAPRPNLPDRARDLGFDILEFDGEPYWDESAYYAFSLKEIEDDLEAPTNELAALCVELAGRIVGDERALERLRIPERAWDLIAQSWRRRDLSLYGRFDLAYDGTGPARLLEYNADTPTSLFEAAVFQWMWLEDSLARKALPSDADQFNSLHEKLVARLRLVANGRPLHLGYTLGNREDQGFIDYLSDCARQAGLIATPIGMADIGLRARGRFVDLANRPIELLFKLEPWEYMLRAAFGKAPAMLTTRFIEPPWKMVLSNKGMLPLLWEMAPGHPNLLPAYFESDLGITKLGGRYARKPLYSREGGNVTLADGGRVVDSTSGDFGAEGYIRQALVDPPTFSGRFPIIGSWLIGEEACGIGIREQATPITRNNARFVPHAIIR